MPVNKLGVAKWADNRDYKQKHSSEHFEHTQEKVENDINVKLCSGKNSYKKFCFAA